MKVDTSKPAYVVGFMVATAAVFTGAIMTLDVSTRDLAERNRKLKVQRWLVRTYDLYKAQPGATRFEDLTDDQVIAIFNRRVDYVSIPAEPDRNNVPSMSLYVVYSADKHFAAPPAPDQPRPARPGDFKGSPGLMGVAFPLEGIGFWELIQGWMAVDASCDTVQGVLFTRHAETPGLGGKITTDRKWLAEWKGKSVSAPPPGKLFFYVTDDTSVPPDRRIDALTAATQTSIRLQDFGNENVRRFRKAMGLAEEKG